MLQAQEPKRGGMVVGPPHNPDGTPGGGVHFVTEDTGRHIEEEGFEINVPSELRKSTTIHTFRGNNAKILDQILKLADLSLSDKVTNVRSGDVVICVRSAWDTIERELTGTIDEILHQINTSNGCKPILKDTEIAKNGGVLPKGVKPRVKDWQAEDPNSPRWKKKRARIQELSNNTHRLRLNVSRDLQSDNERTALTALVVAVMDRSAERIGNDDSADNGHFGVTGFRKNHITIVGSKVHLEYVGKSGTKHDKSISDIRIARALKKAIKNAPGKFIFETSDGFRIKSDKVNRYLEPFNISAKDLRGYNANKWIIELLKKQEGKIQNAENQKKARKERKKIFNKAVKETAARVGHGPSTLKKHYMIPELPLEYIDHGRIIDMKNLGYYKEGSIINEKSNSMKTSKTVGQMATEYVKNWKIHRPRYLIEFEDGFYTDSDYNRAVAAAKAEGEASIIDIKTKQTEFYSKGKRILKEGSLIESIEQGEEEFQNKMQERQERSDIISRIIKEKYDKQFDPDYVGIYSSEGWHGEAKKLWDMPLDELKKMNEGGSTCGCFHSFLKKENPELVEELLVEDVNSNPELRAKVDAAHMAWQGGKL